MKLVFALLIVTTAFGQAPTVVTSPVTPLYPTSAQLNGTVNTHGLSTRFYFEIGRTTNYEVYRTDYMPLRDSTVLILDANMCLVGLKTDSLYHYRLVAISSSGTAIGNDVTFKLDSLSGKMAAWTPDIMMWEFRETSRPDSTFELDIVWYPNIGYTTHDTTRTQVLEYDASGTFLRAMDHWCLGDTIDVYKDTVRGLRSNRLYYVRSRNSNMYGPSPWSTVRTFSTLNFPIIPGMVLPKNGALVQ